MHRAALSLFSLPAFALSLAAATFTGHDGKTVQIDNPQRVVALNTSTFEILQDLGEDPRIAGVDTSTFPFIPEADARARGIANFGHPYRPNIEAIIAARPDLVIAPADSLRDATPEQLRSAKIPVLILEPSAQDGIDGLKRRIAVIAAALGKQAEGEALIKKIDARMTAIRTANAVIPKKKNVFFLYTHGPGKAFIYGRDTGSHWLIELAGAHNAADFTTGTKPLTPEALVQASPDAFILLERGVAAMGGMEAVFTIPGVNLTPAGRTRTAFTVDNSIRWIGTRFLDHVEKLHRELYPDSK
ncbi:ABC-type hemin transport system, periplasmic component [Opitutaceae bacterium TAV1]|nr:ABC-type hemin transport system, periplasmic component [Opitutaceae bacterium TAV1]